MWIQADLVAGEPFFRLLGVEWGVGIVFGFEGAK